MNTSIDHGIERMDAQRILLIKSIELRASFTQSFSERLKLYNEAEEIRCQLGTDIVPDGWGNS